MNTKTVKGLFMAFVVVGVLLSGIGSVAGQSNAVPYNETGISDNADDIEYVVTGNDTYPSSSVVSVSVDVIGVNETDSGNTTTSLQTETLNVAEGSTVVGNYNVTDANRSEYDSYRVNVTGATDGTTVSNVESVDVNVMSVNSGGAIFTGDGFLSGDILGIPMTFVLLLVAVGLFLFYNDNDEFD